MTHETNEPISALNDQKTRSHEGQGKSHDPPGNKTMTNIEIKDKKAQT